MNYRTAFHQRRIFTALAVLTLVFLSQATWAGEPCPLSGYSMSYIANEAHGDLIADNRLVRAIERLSNGADPKAFATKTNLCVARTMAGQLSRAGYACRRALEMATEEMEAANATNRHDAAGHMAIASINLGVATTRARRSTSGRPCSTVFTTTWLCVTCRTCTSMISMPSPAGKNGGFHPTTWLRMPSAPALPGADIFCA